MKATDEEPNPQPPEDTPPPPPEPPVRDLPPLWCSSVVSKRKDGADIRPTNTP